ncbi:4-hydroxybenzoate octaprenyltransferase [Polycladidibacter hongkongensis]|uniref:4-hydroxybenzoate octaprenyltransferase n=1 Tax=Polycladidibacter hongkongensis TaxID=1647556 RepID=UPI00083181B6|nr:4-hydroxybenzoate octaprenyltransferase [Pseudovibrio hongkongensis]
MFNAKDTGPVADAIKNHWVDTHLPAGLRPYARLARWERPIGWWLLLWPCLWSLMLAMITSEASYTGLGYAVLFFIGAVVMRGAGCTYNDIVDTDIDAKVARTASRPIPAGQVTKGQAKIFLILQALVGLFVLLQLNSFSIVLGLASLGVVAAYPFMKRITHWPQLVLGLAFSWGALIGWAVIYGALSWPPVLVYAGGVLWTIGYDTIYAHQDKEDDALVGVKSTALLFGEKTKLALIVLYSTAMALFAAAYALCDVGLLGYLGLALGGGQLLWQIKTLSIADGAQCLALFKSNSRFGAALFLGLLADWSLQTTAML